MTDEHSLYGLMAEFSRSEALLNAARQAYETGYRKMDAFTPFPVDGLAENLGRKKSRVPLFVLLSGVTGGLGGYFMEWYAMAVDYPINVGGRPLNSWPAFVPITFELTILSGALAAIVTMLALNRLPRPHHPVFNAAGFERASIDRFFLCIEADDPKFSSTATRDFLQSLESDRVSEVPK